MREHLNGEPVDHVQWTLPIYIHHVCFYHAHLVHLTEGGRRHPYFMFLNSELHENMAYVIDWLRVVREGGGEGKQRVKEKNEVKTTGSTIFLKKNA